MHKVPGHRADNRKRPTTALAVTMSWKDELIATDTAKTLAAGNIGSECAAVHQVLGRPAWTTSNGHSKLILDTYKNVQPVLLSVT